MTLQFRPALPKKAWADDSTVGLLLDLEARELSLYLDRALLGRSPIAGGEYRAALSCYTGSVATLQHGVSCPPQ